MIKQFTVFGCDKCGFQTTVPYATYGSNYWLLNEQGWKTRHSGHDGVEELTCPQCQKDEKKKEEEINES